MGTAELSVRGRKSGEWRQLPVNPLPYEGGPLPRLGARPLRVGAEHARRRRRTSSSVGRRVQEFTAVELPDAEKPVVLRTYLKKWGWEVGRFFGDVDVNSTDEELLAAAPKHPVFRITVKP